jgi:hypothetical protein
VTKFVLVGFDTDEAALKFLEHLDNLDEQSRLLLVAEKLPNGKAKLTDFKIRTAYLKNE